MGAPFRPDPRLDALARDDAGRVQVKHWPKPRASNPNFLSEEIARHRAALAREAARPLNYGLRFLNADGSRNEGAIKCAITRRLAQFEHYERERPGRCTADLWRIDVLATTEAEIDGEMQIWNVRAGLVTLLSETEARELSTDGPLHGGTRRW